MNEKFVQRMADEKVAHDTRVVADFIRIYCDGHHADREKHPAATDAASLGVFEGKHPALCDECEAHLAYSEKRRAYCPEDPKPFCAHCETHCYRPEERAWQAQMMRYSGPRSWREGHMADGIRHAVEGIKWKREMARRAKAEAPSDNREESR